MDDIPPDAVCTEDECKLAATTERLSGIVVGSSGLLPEDDRKDGFIEVVELVCEFHQE